MTTDDNVISVGVRTVIIAAERQRRYEASEFAKASVALEGFTRSKEDQAHADRFINGEIDLKGYLAQATKTFMVGELVGAQERAKLEGSHTDRRSLEIQLDPVRGTYDAAHLKEINRRIFQDLPGFGFDDVTPGQYRPAVPDGSDWMKNRGLSTQPGSFFVAYSRMDAAAQIGLAKTLESADPAKLRELNTAEFIKSMAKLYTELDFAHPFSDGNSRTLRVFTQQLARESGYNINWEKFALNDTGRDLLYIARDKSVNKLAKPHMQHEHSMLKIIQTEARMAHSRDLLDLLRDVVRPLCSLACERMTQTGCAAGAT